MVSSSLFPPKVGHFDLIDGTRGVENKDLLRAEFSVTHIFSFSPYHQLNLLEVSLAEKGNAHGMAWTVIPANTMNLHWQKDNSNDIHLISLDRFRTCFSLTQKWIREQ